MAGKSELEHQGNPLSHGAGGAGGTGSPAPDVEGNGQGAHTAHGGGHEPSVAQVNQSNETVQAQPGANVFVIASPTQTGDVINGFTLGQDALKIHGHGDLANFSVHVASGNTAVMDGANTIVTLNGVQATSLQSLFDPHEQNEPTVIHVDHSAQTVAATPGKDVFVFGSLAQTGDVITGFTPGEDALVIQGLHDLAKSVTLVPDVDGVSTDVNATSDGHTLVTLENVLPSSLTEHGHFIG